MKVLALDLALTTGWALLEGEINSDTPKLLDYGAIKAPELDPSFSYPLNNIERVEELGKWIEQRVFLSQPDVIVIEQLNRGMNRHSQTLLAFIHHRVLISTIMLPFLQDSKIHYLDSSSWRAAVKLGLTKEQRAQNLALSKAKSKAKKAKKPLDKEALGITGKITKKHLSVNLVNFTFGLELKKKDDDVADAVLQGLAYLKGAKLNYGK